jgi:TLC domain
MNALAHLTRPLSTTLNLSTLPLHMHHILTAFLLYEFLFRLASPLLSTYLLFPRAYARLAPRARTNWHVHVVSTLQALLITAMALHVILTDPERERERARLDWRERLWGYSPETGRVQGWAAGYFLWDALASVEHLDVLGASSLVHAVAALGVTGLGFVSVVPGVWGSVEKHASLTAGGIWDKTLRRFGMGGCTLTWLPTGNRDRLRTTTASISCSTNSRRRF